ncbi:cytochrome P450 [Crossiella sp. SN42]|uniref:cytochrome P450 n=1 Tax=Crossiella sp. SN42 TaxID=2944808 RepID=UPI00207D668B|nr:cytochrome P450 [Crossiella sp. SN42]MCO1580362.1 cytochrome P450 [Crossiella sp. SN42]
MTDPIAYPFRRPSPLEPPRELATLRQRPVLPVRLPSGDTALLVTRYADVRRLLTDHRLSRNLNRPGAARISRGNALFQDVNIDPDPPAHTRVRRLVTKAFTPARVAALRPLVQGIVDELLDRMSTMDGPVDLNAALAFPLPIRVVCHLLGVPAGDVAAFRGWTDAFLSIGGHEPERIRRSMLELSEYIAKLIAAKRADPGEDLVSALISVRDNEDGRLTEYELHWWCRLMLLVGYETTATQLAGGVAMLLAHPDQLALLRADFGLLPQAIEELLRWKLVGSSVSMLRYATEDIPLDEGVLPAGSSVIPAVDSANQDETVFADPRRFDITRTGNEHLTFSLGPHYCVGTHLARLELQVATESLLRRFPTLRLAVPSTELHRQEHALLEGFLAVPVTW